MNLTCFLKQVDAMIEKCSDEQLVTFIHDIGRTLPEKNRKDFLKRLEAVSENSEDNTKKEFGAEFDKQYQIIRNNLKKIDSQEISITKIWNEEYDDWYNSEAEEFYYEDEDGVSDMLAGACNFVHNCMDMGKYKEGFEIGKQLFYMKILCVSEYGDDETSISDIVYHELLQCDLNQVILDTLYCAYHATDLEERPEELYKIIMNTEPLDITLEMLMQHGDEELIDFQEFLKLWIAYLSNITGDIAENLLGEAVGLLNDIHMEEQYAKKFARVHPELYLKILEDKNTRDINSMISLGLDAMDRIPKKYVVRSKVALKTAEYLIEAGEDQPLVEKCYFAAYESDTCATNYLRALLNGYGTKRNREALYKVLNTLPMYEENNLYCTSGNHLHSGRKENRVERKTLLLLKFLNGQFADVLSEGLCVKAALGWSGTFMKQGLALFLLYFYEGNWADKGIKVMADIVKNAMGFSAEEYIKGLYIDNVSNDNDLFCHLFSEWKSLVTMQTDVKQCAIGKIEKLIEKRTKGIMEANRRNYYGECVAYIAALGEVLESMGHENAKQKLMTSYREKYPRRSAFVAELRAYGWIDLKRKKK